MEDKDFISLTDLVLRWPFFFETMILGPVGSS